MNIKIQLIISFFFYFKEGPHTVLKDEEFFDALDQSLDRIDKDSDNYQRLVSVDFSYIKLTVTNKDNDKMHIYI